MNHKNDFKNVNELAECIENYYSKFVGKTADGITAENQLELALSDIPTWQVSKAEECLEKICNLQDIEHFAEVFFQNENFQKFFQDVMSSKPNSKVVYFISFLLQNGHSREIPNLSKLENWLARNQPEIMVGKELTTVSDFLEVLEKISQTKLEFLHSTPISQLYLKHHSRTLVSLSLKSLLQNSDQLVEKQLLVMLLDEMAGFDRSNWNFTLSLDPAIIDRLYSELKDIFQGLLHEADKNKLNEQVYIFMEVLTSHIGRKPFEINQLVQKMKLLFGSSLCPEIAEMLEFEAEPVEGFQKLADNFKVMLDSKERDIKADAAGEHENGCYNSQNVETTKNKLKFKTREMQIIHNLGLEQYFPNKLSLNDVIQVGPVIKQTTEKNIAFQFLQKLAMNDFHARDLCFPISDDDNNDEEDETTEGEECKWEDNQFIHSMDILMSIYFCSDPFMWQFVVSKLSLCQFGLPFLIPNPFTKNLTLPSWSFRALYKTWNSAKGLVESQAIYDAELPMVAFFRFGLCSKSKSEILSSLLMNQKHDVFFHRNSKNSREIPIMMNGVVEIAWFFPTKKDTERRFEECITFTNLHGDANDHNEQFKILANNATVNVVLMESEESANGSSNLQFLKETGKPLIIIGKFQGANKKTNIKLPCKLKACDPNPDFIKILQTKINERLSISCTKISIRNMIDFSKNQDVEINEVFEDCKIGQKLAFEIMQMIEGKKSIQEVKNCFLPLQDKKLWGEWCEKDKELHRLCVKDNMSIEQYKSHLEKSKKDIRNKQAKLSTLNNSAIQILVDILQHA